MYKKLIDKVVSRTRRLWSARRLQSLIEIHEPILTRLGTSYGGWTLPTSNVRSGSTALCVGAGEDISFDVELNKKGITVYTLDPTPRAREHVARVLASANGGARASINNSPVEFYDMQGFDETRFKFLDVGLWNQNTLMRFFAPRDQSHVSHSIVNLQHTEQYFEAKCMTLRSVCESLKLDAIDILKLDIEGAEHTVLKNMVEVGPRPSVLCVEFDEIGNPLDGGYMERILDTMQMLKEAGYKFRHLENSPPNALFWK
jgi:FkbM family methyltransferase